MNYRITYLRDNYQFDHNGKVLVGQPVGCLALSVKGKEILYQYSVLNPKDKFERKLARHLAVGRLTENPIVLDFKANDSNMHKITEKVMTKLSRDNQVPARARKAAKRWLRLHAVVSSEE